MIHQRVFADVDEGTTALEVTEHIDGETVAIVAITDQVVYLFH
ncbi:hypothetical protein [Gracilibacillus halophilus]|nr:hypothetical protein [Gracilibacillus halophilus]